MIAAGRTASPVTPASHNPSDIGVRLTQLLPNSKQRCLTGRTPKQSDQLSSDQLLWTID